MVKLITPKKKIVKPKCDFSRMKPSSFGTRTRKSSRRSNKLKKFSLFRS
jgi:hypothetical protein